MKFLGRVLFKSFLGFCIARLAVCVSSSAMHCSHIWVASRQESEAANRRDRQVEPTTGALGFRFFWLPALGTQPGGLRVVPSNRPLRRAYVPNSKYQANLVPCSRSAATTRQIEAVPHTESQHCVQHCICACQVVSAPAAQHCIHACQKASALYICMYIYIYISMHV